MLFCNSFPFFQLEEIIQGGLEGNEYVSLLSWVMNTYPGVELMSHPDLKVDLSIISPLIRPELLKELEQQYLKVGNNLRRQCSKRIIQTISTFYFF